MSNPAVMCAAIVIVAMMALGIAAIVAQAWRIYRIKVRAARGECVPCWCCGEAEAGANGLCDQCDLDINGGER